jgi:hypothetical protein
MDLCSSIAIQGIPVNRRTTDFDTGLEMSLPRTDAFFSARARRKDSNTPSVRSNGNQVAAVAGIEQRDAVERGAVAIASEDAAPLLSGLDTPCMARH